MRGSSALPADGDTRQVCGYCHLPAGEYALCYVQEFSLLLFEVAIATRKKGRMGMQHDFFKKQSVEVRVSRAGIDRWLSAKILSVTRNGAYVQRNDMPMGRELHVVFKDLRALTSETMEQERQDKVVQLGAARKPTPAFNPVLSSELAHQLEATVAVTPKIEAKDSLPLSILDFTGEEDLEAELTAEEVKTSAVETAERRTRVRRDVPPTKLGDLLRNARVSEGLSQQELGDLVGCSQPNIGRYERGVLPPPDSALRVFADLFKKDYAQLVELRDSSITPEVEAPVVEQSAAPTPPPPVVQVLVEVPKAMPTPTTAKAEAPEARDVFFEFCDKVEEVCPRPTNAAGKARWRELVKELYTLAKEHE